MNTYSINSQNMLAKLIFRFIVFKIQLSSILFQGDSSVAVLLSLCVCGFISVACFVIICCPFLLLLVPREGLAS